MRKMWKKTVAVVLAVGMLLGVSGTTKTAEAAKKLGKKDFTYYTALNDELEMMKVNWLPLNFHSNLWTAKERKTPMGTKVKLEEVVKTKRGIVLGSSKAKVLKAYGKTKVQKTDAKKTKAITCLAFENVSGTCLRQTKSYVSYKYKKNMIYFFFDKSNKVNIIYFRTLKVEEEEAKNDSEYEIVY